MGKIEMKEFWEYYVIAIFGISTFITIWVWLIIYNLGIFDFYKILLTFLIVSVSVTLLALCGNQEIGFIELEGED